MLPKERVIAALSHREADRIPIGEMAADYTIVEQAIGRRTYYRSKWREYMAYWQGRRDEIVHSYITDIVDLVKTLEWDWVGVPLVPPRKDRYVMPEFLGDYMWRDESGRVKQYSPESEGHAMTVQEIEMSIDDIIVPEEPIQVDESQFEVLEGVIKEIGDTHFVVARIDGGSFPWDVTVGLPDFLSRMITDPEFVHKAIEAHTRRATREARLAIDLGAAAVSSGEDYADNRAPLMGPRLFRRFCLPSLERVVKATHDAGGYFIKHSDGNHWLILDDMVEAGVDGWQGIQHRCADMDLGRLKAKYSGKLCLFGGVEVDTLVRGTPAEVRSEVQHAIHMAGHGGGFALCSGNTLMVGVRYELYQIMRESAREFGSYPLAI